MNREQREGYEQGEIDHTNFRGFPVFRGIFPGTLPDNVQYFSHIWKEEGCSPPSLKEGILPMASNHKQKEDYMIKDNREEDEREVGKGVTE